MERPLVTIIVISYNQGRFIRENLDSIKAQTYSNIELIVGDDASQDDSVQIFDEWLKENRYSAVFKNYHHQNTGLATMLNECIEKANGKYLKLIAADDLLHPEYITQCVKTLIKVKGDIVFTQATSIDNTSKKLKENYFPIPQNPLENMDIHLAEYNFISGATLFFQKESYLKIGKVPSGILMEDYYQVLKGLQLNMKFCYLPDNLILYRRHETNITNIQGLKLQIETSKLQLMFFKDKKYRAALNTSVRDKIRQSGFRYIVGIFKIYILHPQRSSEVMWQMIKKVTETAYRRLKDS